MSLELDNDGPFSERARPAAPAWPVLARLPRVDSPAAASRAPLPTFAVTPLSPEAPPLTYVDPPHADHARSQPAQAPVAAATRHYRIDRGDDRSSARRPHQPPAEPASISDSLFRLHAALAPYRGSLGAAALVVSASLVYWLAIGRHGAPTVPTELLDFRSGLTQEAPLEQEPPAIAAPDPNASALDQPAIDWAGPPRIASAADAETVPPQSTTPPEARSPRRPGEPQQDLASPADVTAPTGPILPPAAAATTPTPAPAAAVAIDNGITPTPHVEYYPSTPFPAFSFVDQAPAAVAERPAPPTDATTR